MKSFIKKIEQINFGLMSPQDIRAMSTVTVEYPDTFEDDGFPIEKGLMDPRMGVLDSKLVCRTCGFRGGDCQGHFGSIELVRPVIHIGFVETIYRILRSTCNECGRVLLDNYKIEYFFEKINAAIVNGERLDDILDEVNKSINDGVKEFPVDDGTFDSRNYCPHCGANQEPIYFSKPSTFLQGRYRLTPADVRGRLEKIIDQDSFILGINPEVARPEWMVLTVLPVPPVTLRPSIIFSNGERLENDLTLKLRDILRINQRLLENLEAGAPHFIIEELWELLQYHVTTFFNNRLERVPPSKNMINQPLNTLIQQINDSFRYRVLNKPINFVASSIVSPDSAISINEVGIPRNIAKEITVPVNVNEWNMEEIIYYIKNGPNNFPGANYVIRNDGRKIRIRNKSTIELILEQLEPGFVVERHLNNKDIVLVNNPNNKFKNFMMAHEVRVLPYDTIRLNPSVCPAYDITFDGSTVNIHILQNDESKAEAKSLLRIQENIITPSIGGPIVGGFDDYILGMFLLTRKGVEFSQEEVFQIMRKLNLKMPKFKSNQIIYKFNLNHGEESFIFKNRGENLTGKELFSLLLPNDLNLLFESSFSEFIPISENEDAFVVIEDGILKQGVIDKQSFGLVIGKILNAIVKNYESDKVRFFIDAISKLGLYSASKFGITTSLNDYNIPNDVESIIDDLINEKLSDFDNNIDYEIHLKDISQSVFEILQDYYKSQYLSNKSNFNSLMVNTQSNLNSDEINSISAFVGQQSFNYKKAYNKRTLPHFKKNNHDENRGFIKSSYLKGLNPTEYFINAIHHRSNQINETIAVSQSSNLMKYLSNALQDLKVNSSGLVTDNQGKVIQTLYGEDNVYPAKSDFGKVVDLDKLIDDIRVKNDKENLNSQTSKYDIYRNTFKNLKNILNDLKNMSKSISSLEIESIGLEDLNEAINIIIPLITNVLESEDENEILENYESYNESYNIFKSIYNEEMEKIQDDLTKLQNKKEMHKLKNKIKNILNDFNKLETKIVNANLVNEEIPEIKYEVESQIRLLDTMLASDNIEELSEVINDSTNVYVTLNSKFDDVINNIKLNDLKLELEEYLPKINELNENLINSNISEMKKNKYSFEIDSLILSINDAQNFYDADRLSLSLINIKNSYNSLKSKIPNDFSKGINESINNEIKRDLDKILSKFLKLEETIDNKGLDVVVLKIVKADISSNIKLFSNYQSFKNEKELGDLILNCEESYNSIIKTINAKDIEKLNDLKKELKYFISEFEDLDDEILYIKSSTSELKSIHKEIESNIKLLKSSFRMRKVENVEKRLDDAKRNYYNLNERIDVELTKSKNHNKQNKQNKQKDLKIVIKQYSDLFEDLYDEANSINGNTEKLRNIKKDIKLNIELIESSSRLRKIEELEKRLNLVRKAYNKLNNELDNELPKIKNNLIVKELEDQIIKSISKLVELDEKISEVDVNNSELKSIHKDIESNVEILKSASKSCKFENVEKTEDILTDAKQVYNDLNKRCDGELAKIEGNNLKLELKSYLSLFEELDEKVSKINEDTPKLEKIKKDIKYNIKRLKSSVRLRRIDKLGKQISLAKKSYNRLNKKLDEELESIKINSYVKELKSQLKDFIPKFIELDEKISDVDVSSSELKSIHKDIESNIKLLEKSSRLRKLEKIEKILEDTEKNYQDLNKKVDNELRKIENNKVADDLKLELKNYLDLFEELNDKTKDVKDTPKLKTIKKDIESNIKLLKSSSRLKRIDKLKERVSIVEKSFKDLNYDLEGELNNIENNNKIKFKSEFNEYLLKYNALNDEINSLYIVDDELKDLSKAIDKNIKEIKYSINLYELNHIKYSSNFKYLKNLEEKLNSIEDNYKKCEKDLVNFKNSYYPLTVKISYSDRKKHYPKNNKNLKNKIKGLLSDYRTLKYYITLKNRANSDKLSNYVNTIVLNIDLLDKSLKFRKTEKIKNSLDVATKNYMVIFYKVKGSIPPEHESNINVNEKIPTKKKKSNKNIPSSKKTKQQSNIPNILSNSFNKSKIRKLINENSVEIVKLRKKYHDNPQAIQKISEISFLNSKLNSKFKNGSYVKLEDDLLDVKQRLSDFEKDFKNDSISNNSKDLKNHVEINKSKIRKLINENSVEIVKLRKKYHDNPQAIQKISEISFLNSKLNSKFKNGSYVKLESDLLKIKKRLNDLKDDINNSSVSNKFKESKNNVKVEKYKDKSIEKPKKTLSQIDILIDNIKNIKTTSNNQLKEYNLLKNKLNKIMWENEDYQNIVSIHDLNNNLNRYLNSVKELNHDIFEYEFIMFNHPNADINEKIRYNQLKIKLEEYSKKYDEFDKKIKIFDENIHVLKNKFKCVELLNEIDAINKLLGQNNLNAIKKELKQYSNELIILKKYFSQLENNIISYNLKTISNGKYDQNIAIRLNEIDSDLYHIKIESSVPPKELLEYLYSCTNCHSESSFWTKFSDNGFSDSDIKNIRDKISNEINEVKLISYDDVELRLTELLNKLIKEKVSNLLKYLNSINCKSKFNLSIDECIEIKNKIRNDINFNKINNIEQIESKFKDFVKQKDSKKDILNQLYEITGEFGIKTSFISYLKENDLSVNDGKEIKEKVKKQIEKGNLKTSPEIQLRIDDFIKQKQFDKTNELLNYLYSVMGQYGVKSSFRNKFSVEELSESDINEIRVNLINELNSNDLKSEEEVDSRIVELIDQKKNEKYDELLEELYKNVGENSLSEEFLTRLSDNNLNEVNGNYIKQIIEEKIRNRSITIKSKINEEIYNLIREERKRQNRAMQKLNEFFINNNVYLIGLASEEKDKIKNIVEKSIKENRLDETEVYAELKKKIEEYKMNKKPENSKTKDDDEKSEQENKSSGGLMSRLKKLFS